MFRGKRWGLRVGHQSVRTSVLVISRLVLLTPRLLVPEPLLPALVEGLGLVHAVPVAAKVAAVPVVAKVAILVAIVATVTTSLLKLVGMSPVSTAAHAAAAATSSSSSSAHVPSVHWAASAHGSSSGAHVAPHRAAPGGSAQAVDGAAAPVEVSTVGESSPEGWGRQEASGWAVVATTGTRSSSKVPSVLETSTAAASLSRSTAATKLVFAPPAAATQTATSFGSGAALVGFLFSGQSGLAFLLVLFQQLGGLLFLHLGIDDLAEALAFFGQGVEAFHFEKSVLRHFFAITLDLLLDSLLEVVVGGADHHSLTLEACKQTHLPLLARGREVGMIQDIVSLLAGSNLDELAQEQWRSLGDGGQFGNVLRLAL